MDRCLFRNSIKIVSVAYIIGRLLNGIGGKMYIDFASDWPAYLFMLVFVIFFVYIIIRGNSKKDAD
jgi:hypothetical protein